MEQYIWTEKHTSCFKKTESRSRSRVWSSSMPLLKDTCCLFKYLLLTLLPPIHEVFHYISAFESLFSFCFSPRMLRSFIISERSTFVNTLSWKDTTLFEEKWTQTEYDTVISQIRSYTLHPTVKKENINWQWVTCLTQYCNNDMGKDQYQSSRTQYQSIHL